jgi:hypothetical protein
MGWRQRERERERERNRKRERERKKERKKEKEIKKVVLPVYQMGNIADQNRKHTRENILSTSKLNYLSRKREELKIIRK